MAGLGDSEERALWRRWSMRGRVDAPAPDALALAAYAEGRLSETAAEPLELWLAAHPEALSEILADIAAARGATLDAAEATIIAKASALVTGVRDNVVPLRRAAPGWRNALAWSSVAASLLAASLAGFAMGSDAYRNFARTQTAEAASDTLDAAAALDSVFNDDSGT
jgi:hypothetical protein